MKMRRASRWLIVVWAALIALAPAAAFAQTADRDCSDFQFQEDAQGHFTSIGGGEEGNAGELDSDGDGVACESLPSRSGDIEEQQGFTTDAADDDGEIDPVAEEFTGEVVHAPDTEETVGSSSSSQPFVDLGDDVRLHAADGRLVVVEERAGTRLPNTGSSSQSVIVMALAFIDAGLALALIRSLVTAKR